jgi:hypothetical protein
MAELQDHLRLQILVDAKRQLEVNKLNGKLMSNSQAIETFEGLVGKTPGSGRTTWSATAAIPASGPEFDYWSACAKGSYHTVQVPMGAKSYIGKGWFDEVEVDQSVNGSAEISFTWTGTFAPLK